LKSFLFKWQGRKTNQFAEEEKMKKNEKKFTFLKTDTETGLFGFL